MERRTLLKNGGMLLGAVSLWEGSASAALSPPPKHGLSALLTGEPLSAEGKKHVAQLIQSLKVVGARGWGLSSPSSKGQRADVGRVLGAGSGAMLSFSALVEELQGRSEAAEVREVLLGAAPELALLLSQTLMGVEKLSSEHLRQLQGQLRADASLRMQVQEQAEQLVAALPLRAWRRRRVLKQLQRSLERLQQDDPSTLQSWMMNQRELLLAEAHRQLETHGTFPGLTQSLETLRQRSEVQALVGPLRSLLSPELQAIQYQQGRGWYDYGGESFLGLGTPQLLTLALLVVIIVILGIVVARAFLWLLPLILLLLSLAALLPGRPALPHFWHELR